MFRALNVAEAVFAAGLLVAVATGGAAALATTALLAAVAVLVVQLALVRPRLARRSDAVLAGAEEVPRSKAHYGYVALEIFKVVALAVGGIALLSSV